MKIRAIIVDDEPHARFRVKHLLKEHPEILVEAECRNGKEAVQAINELIPDLIFLDIQMPDLNGFQVLDEIHNSSKKPDIIFITAYDEYALKAFDKYALDYLLKPVDEDRFNESLKRLKQNRSKRQNWYSALLAKEYERIKADRENEVSFEVTSKGSTKIIFPEEILFAEADGNYVQLYTSTNKYLYRTSLINLSTKLSSSPFLRIHRTVVINTDYIESINYSGNNEFKVIMINGMEFKSGRSYKESIGTFKEINSK